MSRVLVTGGGSGIGLGITRALRARGHEVVITGRRADVLAQAAASLGAIPLPGDVTADPEGIIATAGPLDHLVSNAGTYAFAPVGAWTAEALEAQHRVHVVALALLSQAFAAQAQGPGSVVVVSSTLAERPAPGAGPYAAAKAAQLALVRQLALELAPRQLRANAILPGVVPTDMTAGRAEALVGLHPLGRLGQPADVGEAVAWLLEASWVTGACVPVDGGLLIRE